MTAASAFFVVFIIVVVAGLVISKRMRDAAWKQFAVEMGAEFIEGGFFRSSKVEAHIGDATVILDTYSVSAGDSSTTYTRIKAAFQNRDDFQFKVFRTGLVSKIGKALGAQDIEIGDEEFDRAFTLQSNNESRLQMLLMNQRIRQLIEGQKSIHLSLRNNELNFEVQGVIRDVERLKALFDLFREVLGQLGG